MREKLQFTITIWQTPKNPGKEIVLDKEKRLEYQSSSRFSLSLDD